MLLLAEGLFRLDVTPRGDTLQTVVRNLSTGELKTEGPNDRELATHFAIGDIADYEPSRASIAFTLGSDADRVEVKILIGTLRLADRGTVRVTAQAIIRQAPEQ